MPIPPLFGVSNYEYSADRGFCRINWEAVSEGVTFHTFVQSDIYFKAVKIRAHSMQHLFISRL